MELFALNIRVFWNSFTKGGVWGDYLNGERG